MNFVGILKLFKLFFRYTKNKNPELDKNKKNKLFLNYGKIVAEVLIFSYKALDLPYFCLILIVPSLLDYYSWLYIMKSLNYQNKNLYL